MTKVYGTQSLEIAEAYRNIGDHYRWNNRFDKAKNFYLKSIALYKQFGAIAPCIDVMSCLAKLELTTNDKKATIQTLNEALFTIRLYSSDNLDVNSLNRLYGTAKAMLDDSRMDYFLSENWIIQANHKIDYERKKLLLFVLVIFTVQAWASPLFLYRNNKSIYLN